jgi:hypothetical protein
VDATRAFEDMHHSQDARKLLATLYGRRTLRCLLDVYLGTLARLSLRPLRSLWRSSSSRPRATVSSTARIPLRTPRAASTLPALAGLCQSRPVWRFSSLSARPKPAEADDWMKSLTETVARTADTCVFCPARIFEKVPRFAAPIVSEQDGRFAEGEALVFPNLNPFGEGHAVAVVSKAHFLSMQQYTPELLKNSFLACLRCFAATHRAHPALVHPTLGVLAFAAAC